MPVAWHEPPNSCRRALRVTAEIAQQIVNWLALGSIYSLLAVGFSLLFGVLGVIHFSHGDVSLLGPFIALFLLQSVTAALGASYGQAEILLAVTLAIAVVGVIGVAADRIVLRHFRDQPALMALVVTVALGVVLRELIRHVFPEGSNPHAFPGFFRTPAFSAFGIVVSWFALSVIGLASIALGLLYAILHRTPAGVRIRAVSQDREAARLMGINADAVFRNTFFIASATGGLAGVLFASHVGVTRFDFGIVAGLMGFSAAVVGGLGSVPGAIIGGFLLAGIETVAQATVPDGTAYRQVFAFLLVIGFLVFRPTGLMGRRAIEKV